MKRHLGFLKGQNVLKGHIVHQAGGGGGTSYVILTVPGKAMVTDVLTHVTEAWVGGTTLDIGDLGDVDGFLKNAQITQTLDAWSGANPAARGDYLLNGLRKVYATPTNILYTIVDTYTAGEADVYVIFTLLE